MVFIKAFTDLSMSCLVSDLTEVARVHPLAGILSNLGILLWSATAAILFFSAFLLYNYLRRPDFLFLLVSAIFTGYLLFDDLFRFHEIVAWVLFGLEELVIYILIIIGSIIYTIIFFRLILSTKHLVFFFLALAFLGFSLMCDTPPFHPFMETLGDGRHLLEEGLKWLGIVSWSAYFIMTSFRYVDEQLKIPEK